MFLTADELRELSACCRKATVRQWLDQQRIPYLIAADGWPRVSKAVICARLGESDECGVVSVDEGEALMMSQEPWKKDGLIPIEWFARNLQRFIFHPAHIVENATPYKLNDGADDGGVYFLLDEAEILYVGISNTISRRLVEHRESGRRFSRYWSFGGIPRMFLEQVEAYYIYTMLPPLNVKMPLLYNDSPIKAAIAKAKHAMQSRMNEK